MKKFILSLFLFTQLFGNDGCKSINEVQEEFISEATKKYNIKCGGTGASFPNKIESFYVRFEVDKLLSTDKSRLLIVNLVKDFQIIINKNEKVKQYLATVPFSADRINIALSIHDGNKFPPPDVFSHVYTARGNVIFRTNDVNKSSFEEVKIKEPLEEACEKTGISIPLIRSTYSDYGKKKSVKKSS